MSNRLLENKIQIRDSSSNNSERITMRLSPKEYNKHGKEIETLKLDDINAITTNIRKDARQSKKRQHDNSFETMEPGTYIMKFDSVCIKHKKLKKLHINPPFYQAIINSLAKDPIDTANTHKTHKLKDKTPTIDINTPEEIIDITYIDIWTDGSFDPISNRMGSSAIFVEKDYTLDINNITKNHAFNTTKLLEMMSRPTEGFPSSTRAELFAIYTALAVLRPNQHVRIFTDSQAAIDGIKKFKKNKYSIRKKIKLENHGIIEAIDNILEINKNTTFIKVKGHSNLKWNEQADVLANRAKISDETMSINPTHSTLKLLHHNGQPIERYPSTFIESIQQTKYKTEIHKHLENSWPTTDNQQILATETVKIAIKGGSKKNRLDTSAYRQTSFKTQTISKTLPVGTKLKTFKNIKLTNTAVNIPSELIAQCKRCNKHEETIQHLIGCKDITEIEKQELEETAINLIETMRETAYNYRKIKEGDAPGTAQRLLEAIGFYEENFYQSNTILGIITTTTKQRFINSQNIRNLSPARQSLWLRYSIDCVRIAIHETIWKQRNDLTFNFDYDDAINKREQTNQQRQQQNIMPKRIKLIFNQGTKEKENDKQKNPNQQKRKQENIPRPTLKRIKLTLNPRQEEASPGLKRKQTNKEPTDQSDPTPKKRLKTVMQNKNPSGATQGVSF